MKNRGFLTRPTLSPLGTHKDQTPADVPNQQVANVTAEFTRENAIALHQGPPQPNPPIEESGTSLRAKASSAPTGTAKRYTLVLKLDSVIAQRLAARLEHLGPSERSAAKRALLLAFRSHVVSIPLNGVRAAAPVDAVSYRIDIRLPEPLVRKLLAAAGQSAFEPRATALARSLATHFADFVRGALASNSAAAPDPLCQKGRNLASRVLAVSG